MSGLMDKAKDALGKAGGSSSTEKKVDSAANKQIDAATDKAGLGDKYDSKISQAADVSRTVMTNASSQVLIGTQKQINSQMGNQGK